MILICDVKRELVFPYCKLKTNTRHLNRQKFFGLPSTSFHSIAIN